MNLGRRLATLAANLAWLIASLPGALAFVVALCFPQAAQRRILRRIVRTNRHTEFGRAHEFASIRTFADLARVPPGGYEAFRPAISAIQRGVTDMLTHEPITLLQPTSGTSAAPKLIPFTRGLQQQFGAALAPWIASLYLLRPRLLLGRQYWCVSPNTRARGDTRRAVPVGFADDTEYLGRPQRWLARHLLTAPPELAHIADPAAFEFLTRLFLLADDNVRLISVWHPSFLTLLIEGVAPDADRLAACLESGELPPGLTLDPDVRARLQARLPRRRHRASALRAALAGGDLRPSALWPRLQVISCWDGPACVRWTDTLRRWFPRAAIQAKGLLATEGVVTIPWGFSGRQVCAVRSHVLEFADPSRREAPLLPCASLPPSGEYTVVLTTAGGLYRYRLDDRVRVRGRVGRTPCLEFVRRDGLVCDLCGEKLCEGDAEAALAAVAAAIGVPVIFGMLVPDRAARPPGYVLLLESAGTRDPAGAAEQAEQALQGNFHYHHARRLGQLAPVRLHRLPRDAAARARAWLVARGLRHGDIKFPALRTEDGWLEAFPDPRS